MLGGNQLKDDSKRLSWKTKSEFPTQVNDERKPKKDSQYNISEIILNPMEIRTFVIELNL